MFFGRKDASHFLDEWILIIHQVITCGSVLNWGGLYIFQSRYLVEQSSKGT